MKLKLVTVPFDPATGSFAPDPLQGLEHFFHHDSHPYLLLVVHTREAEVRRRRAEVNTRGEGRADPRAELTADEREVYDKVRAWRQSRSEGEGLPPYALLTNRQVAEVARRAPRTLEKLKEVPGIGDAKAERFGSDLLRVLAHGNA